MRARRRLWGRHLLLALDHWYDRDGTRREDKTLLYVPNEYCVRVAERYPEDFRPAVSVHPFRRDAADELGMCFVCMRTH